MRFFGHTIVEYTCNERCGYHLSIPCSNFSKYHLLVAGVATIPLWLMFLREPWRFPWYFLFCILAGEIMLFFLIGFFLSFFFLMPWTSIRTRRCKKCGAPMFMAGSHFDPKGSKLPNWDDIIMFFAFVGINIAIWVIFLSGYFVDIAMSTK
jgi:hypothetical protein